MWYRSCARGPWRRAAETPTYLEEEVEPEQSAAGDDGEPRRVPAGDGLRHVSGILGETERRREREARGKPDRDVHGNSNST